jgi:hypothetical protein
LKPIGGGSHPFFIADKALLHVRAIVEFAKDMVRDDVFGDVFFE